MKRNLCLTIAAFAVAGPSLAQVVLGYWNFNGLTAGSPPSNANQTSYTPTSGSATLTLSGWTSRAGSTAPFGINNFAGSLLNAQGADPAGQALALEGGTTALSNNGALIIFSFNMAGRENPIFSFAGRDTATGFQSVQVAYSTDGASYTDFGSALNMTTTFASQSYDLSSINALDGDASVFIRMTLTGASGASGNNRYDNFLITATPVPEPHEYAALAGAGLIGFAVWRRRAARKA